jgi:hypothetical protein
MGRYGDLRMLSDRVLESVGSPATLGAACAACAACPWRDKLAECAESWSRDMCVNAFGGDATMHLAPLRPQVSRGEFGVAGKSPGGSLPAPIGSMPFGNGGISGSSILPEVKVKAVSMLYLIQMQRLSVPLSIYPRRLPT